ncbi:MAG: hypothetical protein AAGJ34_08510 [Pseudomonadota bacterium]
MTSKDLFSIGSIFAVALLYASGAWAQSPTCGPRAKIIQVLNDRFKETRQSYAVDGQNRRFETFANAEKGSWTLVISDPSGKACIIAVGHSFETTSAS